MSAIARTVVRCDRYRCEAEFVYSGNFSTARRAAVRRGWHSGRSLDDMRRIADYCPEHAPARSAAVASSTSD